MAALTAFPVKLTRTPEHELFKAAANEVKELFPSTKYVRIVLVAEDLAYTDVFELCDSRLLSDHINDVEPEHSSEMDAMQRRELLVCGDVGASTQAYADWQLLAASFGMRSIAVVPLKVAQQVYGCILACCPDPNCFVGREPVLNMLACALAPHAAMMHKQQQVEVTNKVLQMMLPARVTEMITERIGWSLGTMDWPGGGATG